MNQPTIHPEIVSLRQRVADAKAGLRAALDEWHHLSTDVRPRINAAYHAVFGELERELQHKAVDNAELFRRVELLSIKVARGERLTAEIIDLVNQVVTKEYSRFRRRVREAFDVSEEHRERSALGSLDTHEDAELVNMYRTLVKKLHPDAVGEGAEHGDVWHAVQNAYRERNASQMRSLLAVLGAVEVPSVESQSWDIQRFQREVQTLEARLRVEERKLARLRGEEPFNLENVIDDELWRVRHFDELRASIAAKDKEIAENTTRYQELTGGTVPLGTHAVKTEDEASFDEDFMKNTYFGRR